MGTKDSEIVLIACGQAATVKSGLGRHRLKIGHESGFVATGAEIEFRWVVDFPLCEYGDDAGRYTALNHPFNAPINKKTHLLDD